tara:strand:+ start:124 stop:2100 length:1977 start_codon:yes stop_codon:yes gene_type:complete
MIFKPDQWLFAFKLYLAAMMAFTISAHIGLPETYWTIVTCCVVMNPMSGAVRSKAVYRFTGTFCGGLVSLILVSFFANTPILMIAFIGLIGAVAFGCSLLDRTPRSYGFQLFGLTLMIVAIPYIEHPATLFDIAIFRICEIGLGIICCTMVDSIIAPRSLKPGVQFKLQGWLADMEKWIDDAFEGHITDDEAVHDRLKALSDISSLSALAAQLRYDPLVTRRESQLIFSIQLRLLRLVPLLSAISSRIADAEPDIRNKLTASLKTAAAHAKNGEPADEALLTQITQTAHSMDSMSEWRHLVQENMAELLKAILHNWSEIRQCQQSLEQDSPLPPILEKEVSNTRSFKLYPDTYIAKKIFIGSLISYSLLCVLWYATGWHHAPAAVLMGVAALAFFGGSDEGGRAITLFGRFTIIALFAASILSYGLLPLANDYPMFLIIMAIFILPIGAWATKNPMAILLLAMAFSSINFQSSYQPYDFGVFLEICIANLLGIFIAFCSLGLVRTLGAKHTMERLIHEGREEVLNLTYRATPRDRDAFLNRSLDKIGSLASRLEQTGQINTSSRVLSRLRAAASIAELRHTSAYLNEETRRVLEDLFTTIRQDINHKEPSDKLLAKIDNALSTAWKHELKSAKHPLLRGLIGLRLALFEYAPAWRYAP